MPPIASAEAADARRTPPAPGGDRHRDVGARRASPVAAGPADRTAGEPPPPRPTTGRDAAPPGATVTVGAPPPRPRTGADAAVAAVPSRVDVAIVGGGFSGAAVALHLLRDHPGLASSLAVVEPRATLGAGLAYSTLDPEHRVNVAASRLSPFVEDPGHFERWLAARGTAGTDPASLVPGVGCFPRRAEFGRYVAEQLLDASAGAPAARLHHLRDRAGAVLPEAGGFRIALEGGGSVQAGLVVLATGHPPPALPAPLQPLRNDPRLLPDPWDPSALDRVPPDGDVLVLGSGLTGCDVAASLRARGHRGRLLMVSRHGLLPRPRTRLPVEAAGDFATRPSRRAGALLRRVRAAVAAEAAHGRPWEGVIAALRDQAPVVWGTLPTAERRRVLRHLRAFWDVHRFQCSPQVDALVRRELASGDMVVLAASLLAATPEAEGLRVVLRPRGGCAPTEARVAALVNCTGPGHRSMVAGDPVLRGLAAAGLLEADALGLGIAVDWEGRVVSPGGAAQDALLVAGPPARGTRGELMGLPQVSAQPREVAARIAAWIRNRPAPPVRAEA